MTRTTRVGAGGFLGVAAVVALSVAAGPGCARPEPPPVPAVSAGSSARAPSATTPSAPPASSPNAAGAAAPELAPAPRALPEAGTLVSLEVSGFEPAIVAVPRAARAAHPVAVALHGNFDRPEWQCEVFRAVIGEHGFLLCPRGVPRRGAPKSLDRWEYASGAKMADELEAALAALTARYGSHVAPGPVVFIGFSLGAIYGAALVQKQPARFPRAVFVEGGHAAWNVAAAKKYASGGGARLFLACGQAPCLAKAERLAERLEAAGLPTRSGGSAKAGHTYDGDVADAVREAWPWLVEGDMRWN